MPLLARLLQFSILALVLAVVAFLAIVLAAFAVAALLAAFILHKLGWDRRLAAYLMRKQGVHVATFRFEKRPEAGPFEERPEADPMDAPIEARWTMIEERRPG